jgi:uncharacterized RDD family membrane protein YckC
MPAKKKTAKKTASKNHAGFVIRLVAALIDAIIVGAFQGLARYVFPGQMVKLVSLVVSLGYGPLMLYQYQATLGKMVMKLKVVSEDGKKMDAGQVLLREWIGKFISGVVFGLGFIWVAIDEKKQGWHDRLARTLVVEQKR